MQNYVLHTYFLPKLSFSLDQPVTKNQILNSSVYFYVFFAIQKKRDSLALGKWFTKNESLFVDFVAVGIYFVRLAINIMTQIQLLSIE